MGANVSRSHHEVVIIPDPSVEVWTEETSISEASPMAGVPVPSAATHLALTGLGPQTEDVVVHALQGGLPSRHALVDTSPANLNRVRHAGARVGWRPSSAPSTLLRGWDPPRAPSTWEGILWNDSDIAQVDHLDAVTIQGGQYDGTTIVVAQVRDTGEPDQYRLEALVRSPSTGSWSRVLIEDSNSAPTVNWKPCICSLPNGRVQVYRVAKEPTATLYGVRMWFSEDGGTNWSHGGDGLVDQPVSTAPDRMRCAYADGQVALVVGYSLGPAGSGDVVTYGSDDAGLSFSRVGTVPKGSKAGYFDLVANPHGGFVLAAIGVLDTTGVDIVLLADAFDDPATASAFAVDSDSITPELADVPTGEDITVSVDGTGLFTLMATYDPGASAIQILAALSYTALESSWFKYTQSIGGASAGTGDVFDYRGGSSVDWRGYKLVPQRGRSLLIGSWIGSSPPAGVGLGCAYMGGWTTVTTPGDTLAKTDQSAQGWDGVWYPTTTPGTTSGWTVAFTGTPTQAWGGTQAYVTSCSGTELIQHYRALDASTTQSAARFVLSTDGGSTSTLAVALILETTTASVSIRCGPAGFALWDETAGTQIGSTVTLTDPNLDGGYYQIWVEVDSSRNVVVFYRQYTHSEDRVWIVGPSGQASVAAIAAPEIRWGHLAAAGVSTQSRWREVVWADIGARQVSLGSGSTNPTDLRGRMLAGAPYLGRGLRAAALHGPVLRGEEHDCPATAEWSLANAVEDASPRIGLRTTDLTAQDIVLKWDDNPTPGPRKALALVLRGSNVPEVALSFHNGTTYTTPVTVDLTVGALAWARTGSAVKPNGSDTIYLRHGDYAGDTFCLDGSVGRRIVSHSEGQFSSSADLQPVIRLADVNNATDPASGTVGTIIPSQVVILLELPADYKAVKLTIPAAAASKTPAETYWQIGSIVLGWAYPLGLPSSWGRAVVEEHPQESLETRDRQFDAVQVAPTIRSTEIAWVDGVDQTDVESDTADPDWVALDSAAGASEGGVAYFLRGVLRELHGARLPLVYMPRVAGLTGGGTPDVWTRRRDAIHGRVGSGPIRVDTAVGDEHVDEVVRIGVTSLVEVA